MTQTYEQTDSSTQRTSNLVYLKNRTDCRRGVTKCLSFDQISSMVCYSSPLHVFSIDPYTIMLPWRSVVYDNEICWFSHIFIIYTLWYDMYVWTRRAGVNKRQSGAVNDVVVLRDCKVGKTLYSLYLHCVKPTGGSFKVIFFVVYSCNTF